MNSKFYLLTGAAGYLGSNISRKLLASGEKVRALVLPGDPAAKHVPENVEIVSGDLLDIESLERFFTVPEGTETIVLHCASFVTVNPEPNPKVYAVNVTGTRNILAMCLKHAVKKLVYISSTGAIPELPNSRTIREVDWFDPKAVVGYYGETKAEATQLVLDAVHEKGLDASIVYPSGIAGPNDFGYSFFASFVIDAAMGKMPAGVQGSFNAVDVRDLADGVIACAEKGGMGEGYIMSNDLVTIGEMFRLIARNTGTKEIKTILPVWAAKALAAVMKAASKFTNKPALLTSFAIYNLARNNNFSSEKAIRELGYKTRPFEQTIADTVDWLRQERKIPAALGAAPVRSANPAHAAR